MVELRDDGDDVRRWVALDEIRTVGTGRGLGVLERLASARLVTVEADRATLAHEALLSRVAGPAATGFATSATAS